MPLSDHLADPDRALGDPDAVASSATELQVVSRSSECRDRIEAARQRGGHGQSVVLIAVTKTHGVEAVTAAWKAGIADIGENRVQEAQEKMALTALPLRWHLIGHLQRNKARQASLFSLIHSLDSLRLAEALNEAAQREGAVLDVLLQVNVSGEGTKSGVQPGDVTQIADALHGFSSLSVRGVMTMAPYDAPETILRRVFSGARDARVRLAAAGHPAEYLSMGMSGDFEIAVEEGATHVRLGTILFGERT